MTDTAQQSFGQQLYMGTSAADVAAGLIAQLTSVTPPPMNREMIDVTSHDSPADDDGGVPQEFIPDIIYDPGEMGFTANHLPGSAGDEALLDAFAARTKKYFRLVDNTASPAWKMEGYGYVMTYTPSDRTVKGVKQVSVRIKRSGVWTRGAA